MKKRRPIIILGSDHAGYALKESVSRYLRRAGYRIRDCGAFSAESSDYPEFVLPTAEAVAKSRGRSRGIVFGGSGIGECVAANKVRGIRAALVYDAYTAKMSRLHNDANVLCLGGRTPTRDQRLAIRLVKIWLTTPFTFESRHRRRIRMISEYETASNRRKRRPVRPKKRTAAT